MDKKGFSAMYMVYSLFLVFIILMLSVILINTYKAHFLNTLKNEIKEELKTQKIEVFTEEEAENSENMDFSA